MPTISRRADPGSLAVGADAVQPAIEDVLLARGLRIAQIVRVGPFQFQELDVHGDEPPKHDIMAGQVEDHFMVRQLVPERILQVLHRAAAWCRDEDWQCSVFSRALQR